MARHWYPLAEIGDSFLLSAPFRYERSVETTAPAEPIWAILTGEQLVDWGPTPRPARGSHARPRLTSRAFRPRDAPPPRLRARSVSGDTARSRTTGVFSA